MQKDDKTLIENERKISFRVYIRRDFRPNIEYTEPKAYSTTPKGHMNLYEISSKPIEYIDSGYISVFEVAVFNSDGEITCETKIDEAVQTLDPARYLHLIVVPEHEIEFSSLQEEAADRRPRVSSTKVQVFETRSVKKTVRPDQYIILDEYLLGGNLSLAVSASFDTTEKKVSDILFQGAGKISDNVDRQVDILNLLDLIIENGKTIGNDRLNAHHKEALIECQKAIRISESAKELRLKIASLNERIERLKREGTINIARFLNYVKSFQGKGIIVETYDDEAVKSLAIKINSQDVGEEEKAELIKSLQSYLINPFLFSPPPPPPPPDPSIEAATSRKRVHEADSFFDSTTLAKKKRTNTNKLKQYLKANDIRFADIKENENGMIIQFDINSGIEQFVKAGNLIEKFLGEAVDLDSVDDDSSWVVHIEGDNAYIQILNEDSLEKIWNPIRSERPSV